MAKLRQRLRRTAAAAVSAALLLTAAQMPALSASAAEPVLRMNLLSGGSVIGIGWQLEAPDGLSGYSVTLDGKKVRPEADGTFSSYDYAMDMTQPHTVTVSKGGRQVLKKEASVCSYLNSLLADSTYSEYFPVAKAMLIYGGAVQEYFGVDTEHLASEGIDSTAALNREIPELELQERFLEYLEWFDVYPVTYTGMNLAVQSELRFSLFFETKPGCTAEEAEAYLHDYSFGGEPAVITPYGENGWRMYRMVNVKDLSKVFELTEPDGGFWIVSPLQYLTLAEKSGDEALIRVCKALYNYATVEKRAASPIRSIELKQEEYYDHESMIAGLGTIEEYPPSPEILKKNPGAFRDSLADPLWIDKVSSTGQINGIRVRECDTDQISYSEYSSQGYEECWRDAQYDWMNREDYEMAEKLMCSDPKNEWYRVSALFEEGRDEDVLLLYFRYHDMAETEIGIQNILFDENGKLTVSIASLLIHDYDEDPVIKAYRLTLPHGWLSFDAGESGGDETEPAVTTTTESVSETTETTAVTEATEAQPPIRSIELKKDYFGHWMVSEDHAYLWSADDLQALMLGEDRTKEYELSVPEQLCLERTDKNGQTVKIPVLDRQQLLDWNYDCLSFPDWCQPSDYEETEKLLCSNSENWEYWSHVSAKYEQDDEKDVLLLFVTLYELEGSFALQSLQLDENGKLTVNTSYLEAADYSDGEIVDAYRLEFPKGTFSGEYIPEDDGGQQPEDDAVIRDIELDTEYYYDPEKMYDCGSGMFDEVDPDSEMLVRDPEAFRASLPETLVIEKTDGTGKTVQIPVLKQDRAADEAWRIWGRNNPAPDWLKKQDYKAAEKALCDPMVGMQRVAARLEQGEETDVLLLYFTWNFMSGDLELRNLKFDANGKLTVGVSFCRTTQFGWGEDLYAYRLELPHGALTDDISGSESGGDETEPVIRKVSGGYTHLPDVSSYEYDPNQEEMWWENYTPETLKEYLIKKNKQRYSQDPVHLENTDASGETKKYYVRDSTFTCMDLSESFGWDGVYQSDSLREIAPSWMTQADYDALDEMFDSHAWISARLELCGDKDVLVIYHKYSEVDGDPRVRKILFENGSLSVVFSTEGWAPDFGDELLDIIRLEFPAGAFSGSAEPDADRTVTVIPPLKAQPDIRSVDLEIGRYSLPYWLYLEQEDSDLMSWGLRFPVLNKQTAVLGKELDFSNAPEWLKQEDYEAAEAALVSGQTSDPSEPMDSFRVSAKFERGEDVDVLYLYFTSDAADGSLDISHLYLDRDGKLRVSARFCGESDVCSTGLYAFRLEFPAGAIC